MSDKTQCPQCGLKKPEKEFLMMGPYGVEDFVSEPYDLCESKDESCYYSPNGELPVWPVYDEAKGG